ncbi:MAG: RHS repeat-associated core domain-containing protein, partial [Reinekea sp.]
TGLYQNLHRFYDPHCGRYINHDPIGLMGGLNAYQYCPNPVGWVDPLGLSCKEVPDSEPFKLIGNSQIRGSGGVNGKFINTIDEPFDPLLSNKAELKQGADGRWKLYGVGQPRTAKGSYDYIVQDGKIYVGTMKQRGQGHIDIAQGQPVDYAGQITFGSGKNTKGNLNSWDNGSGHYLPEPVQPEWSDTISLPAELFNPVKHSPY